MISMMEIMEKRIHLIKNGKKKGMTLVEIMAAIAILSILFLGISQLIVGTVKSEARAEEKLEINNYLKSALTLFDVKIANVEDYQIKQVINFKDLEDMQYKIKNINSLNDNNGKFSIEIESKLQDNGLYKVKAHMKNKNIEDTKIIIVNK